MLPASGSTQVFTKSKKKEGEREHQISFFQA